MDYYRISVIMSYSEEDRIISELDKCFLSQRDKDMLFHKTIDYGFIKVMEKLLKLNANHQSFGSISLRTAAMGGRYSVMKRLLELCKFHSDTYDSAFLISMYDSKYNEALLVLPYISNDYREAFYWYVTLLGRYEIFRKKIETKAQKKIYFWWIPICYDPNREVGKRMMERSWKAFQEMTV